ncbi:MAG: SDR family oxidoreductase [Hyphomonas sp.]|uniref:SDR family oxidoreductase n=1 Tax=Hyphomonas sp. TaxID=87 RepID=UPI003002E57A
MRILIAGATGNTGARLVKKLTDAGHTPIAMARESSDTSVLPKGCEIRMADLTNLDKDVANDVDAVVFAAGSGGDTGKDMTDKVDRDGAMALIDAAASAKVSRFVMLSSIGADDPSQGSDSMRHYLEAKHIADTHLKDAGMPYVIVRPISLSDDEGKGLVSLADHVDRDGQVTRDDVAAVLAVSVTQAGMNDKVFEMASGDTPIAKAIANVAA